MEQDEASDKRAGDLAPLDGYARVFEPRHDKTNKKSFSPSEDSDQPGHPPSLISLRCPHEETFGP